MKNRLVEIITNTQTNCVGKDCNKCNYSGQEHCLINRVADKLLEMYERLQKENERLYEIKLDLENQLIQSGLTEYIGADEIEKDAIKEFATELKSKLYNEWCSFDFCKYIISEINELAKEKGVDLESKI